MLQSKIKIKKFAENETNINEDFEKINFFFGIYFISFENLTDYP